MQPNSLQFELPPSTLFFFLVYFVLIELNIGKRHGEFCQKRKRKRKNKPTNQREQLIFTHFKI